ncbi:fibronectin type III domain-containing protein [Chitinophaga horti]|uniref:Fibronectin type III domain-containing protein n=1 Tax=Chitinophaga horti TaxID=2920382 RepID=A0ABY6J6C6_9BACT|nr:fibronectin type III domain-containing protein [Chitinophaga horti]UYQ95238.1 fibronectin type III domain-containing protein [Chitinophaga horti]
MKKFYHLLVILMLAFVQLVNAQGVLDPNDPIVVYNPASPPTEPAYNQIGKWVKTNRISNWNTSSYKCYIFNGIQFRLKFPKSYQHGVADGKKYPVIIFFHGLGERGTKFDNEYQLYHGGKKHAEMVDNGTFDGFLLYPQNTDGYFGQGHFNAINAIINNFMVPNNKVDINRISIDGLSAGGSGVWEFLLAYPRLVASAQPISAASQSYSSGINNYKYTPIWHFQGGVDNNPTQDQAQALYNSINNAGGNVKLTIYPTLGHSCWDKAWAEPDYWPFINRAHKANPWPLTGRTEFCPGDPINVTLGLTPGFTAYEWRKDGNVIANATGNTLVVTSIGTYSARIRRGTEWSEYSPNPVVIKIKAPTVPPTISVTPALSSVAIPSPDGKTGVTLAVPANYETYLWKKTTDNVTLGTAATYNATSAGDYHVRVKEQYGCSSEFTESFKVVNANGANKPLPAAALAGNPLSKTAVALSWNDNPAATYNETGYEIYRSTSAGSGYAFIALTAANATSYQDNNLNANTKYYYIVRAVNSFAASAVSNEAAVTTFADNNPPTVPGNLTITATTNSSVSLSWTASTDDVAVSKYELYVNGVKSYIIDSTATTFTVNGLSKDLLYTFILKSKDVSGNLSIASNQVSTYPLSSGLNYKYYTGSWTSLPNFNNLTPVKMGRTATTDIGVRTQEDNFAFLWEGYIYIPVTGNYTFETQSDAGSKLYIGTYNPNAAALVDNDGVHSAQYREGTIYLQRGSYPITITYFETTGSHSMRVYWKNTAHGVSSRQEIPAAYYKQYETPLADVPAAPSTVKATALTYNKIGLTWADNSNDETGFEIYRATSNYGTYALIGTAAANATSFTDTTVNPVTTYFYQVQAINSNGGSGYSPMDVYGLYYQSYNLVNQTSMPNFDAYKPNKTGFTHIVNQDIRSTDNNLGIRFAGAINITTAGTYTFYTSSNDGSNLYIGTLDSAGLVVRNDGVRSSTVERSGTKTLAVGRYPIYVTYFQNTGSRALSASYATTGLSKRAIPAAAFENPNLKATTFAMPGAPVAPTSLVANGTSGKSIGLTWADVPGETGYNVYRSVNDNSTFTLLAAVDSNTTTYSDTAVFPRTTYYYKVNAKNIGGTSGFSNEANAKTLNTLPVLNTELPDRTLHYATPLTININATDADADGLTLTTTNLPSFATFTDNGDGTGTLNFSPTIATLGTYNDIAITATDVNGGVASKSFKLTVNDNFSPVMTAISNVTLAEKGTAQIDVTATDANAGDDIQWSAIGLPAFASLTSNMGTAQIVLNPTYSDAGTYAVTLTVNDGKGGIDSKTFNINVTDVNPNKQFYFNFTRPGAAMAAAPWNNLNRMAVSGDSYPGIKDAAGNTTGVALTIVSNWQAVNGGDNTTTLGSTTYNNSGVYPDVVISSGFWTQNATQTFKLTGLEANYKYNFTFFGSRGGIADTRTTAYSINGTTVTLVASNNSSNTVSINNISADANGEVSINMGNTAGQYGYIGAMVVNASYDDGNAPAAPRNVVVENTPNGAKLTWTDAAFNETAYEVFRSATKEGTYSLLSPVAAANATTYTDGTVAANQTWFYAVRAINGNGNSAFSDSVSVTVANKNPQITAIANQSLKSDTTYIIPVVASDDAGDVITLSSDNLPAFASLVNTGNGTANLVINANAGQAGTYNNIVINAADDHGGSSSDTFNISVRDKSLTAVYINFNDGAVQATAPWNNFNAVPNAGVSVNNAIDETGAASGIKVTLTDALTAANNVGVNTGNNSGVYPDAVMRSFYYEETTTAKRITISGLSSTRKYNLIFFGSRENTTDDRTTVYSVGAQSVSLNASSNSRNTVQINGLSPDANGNIVYTIKKGPSSLFAYMGALVIQYYDDNGLPLAPGALTADGKTRTSIDLAWQDKTSTETGFEIYRATTQNGTYSLVTTTAANATTYTDVNLTSGTQYYYKVRARVNASTFSEYSNLATAGTMAFGVHVNVSVSSNGAFPWNNTATLPYENQTLTNMIDDQGIPSGINWTIFDAFTGTNGAGAVTGNNTGVYPDKVIQESYYTDAGDTAKIRVTGLNQTFAYSFTFFGSRATVDDNRTTVYNINGQTVSLKADKNSNNVVSLEKITPNENGEIVISIYSAIQFGYLNAMVIQAFPNAELSNNTNNTNSLNTVSVARTSGGVSDYSNKLIEVQQDGLTVDKVFPNPFKQEVYLNVTRTGKPSRVSWILYDLKGGVVSRRDVGELAAGSHVLKVAADRQIPVGMYILQIIADGQPVKSVKLLKQ